MTHWMTSIFILKCYTVICCIYFLSQYYRNVEKIYVRLGVRFLLDRLVRSFYVKRRL